MSRMFPIWYNITNCNYKSSKDFGFRNVGEMSIKIGSSKKNSHHFLKTAITREEETIDGQQVIVFRYSVDGVIIKTAFMEANTKGRAGKLIKIINNE